MAETTVLKSSASAKNVSSIASSAAPHVQTSGAHPTVNVTMGANGAVSDNKSPNKNVTVSRQRAAPAAQGLPAQQGALPVVQINMASKGAAPAPAGVRSVVVLDRKGTVAKRFGEPAPQLTPDQLLFCRHLLSRHLEAAEEATAAIAQVTLTAVDAALAAQAALPPTVATATAAPTQIAVGGGRSQVAAAVSPRRTVPRPPPPALVPEEDPKVIDIGDATSGVG